MDKVLPAAERRLAAGEYGYDSLQPGDYWHT